MEKLESLDHGMADATQPKPIKMAKKKSIDVEREPTMGDDDVKDVVKLEITTTSGPTDGGGMKLKKKKEEAVATKKKKKKETALESSKDVKRGKEKKAYNLPGQKHHPPSARDPLRVFYETLHEQVPTSEMAATWMMERGMLPEDEAKKVYEKKLEKSAQQNIGTPTKAVTVKKSGNQIEKETYASNALPKTAPKKRKSDTSDGHNHFVMSKVV